MLGSKSIIAGIAALAFTAAVHAGDSGSIAISPETRAALGNDIIQFADTHIVNQPALPIVSRADCGTDGTVAPAFRSQFTHYKWTADEACTKFSKIFQEAFIAGGAYVNTGNNIKNILLMFGIAGSMDELSKIMKTEDKKLSLPGTARDWNAFMLFHELQHSRDDINGTCMPLAGEYCGDSGARGYYQQAYRQGLVSDLRVPDAMRGFRVIVDISHPYDQDVHSIALLAGLPDVVPDDVNTPERISQSFMQVKIAIYNEISPSSLIAESEVRDNPHLLYQAAQRLYRQGAFDSDPAQKAYAREFIRAAETYGAGYYGIKSVPAPALTQ